MPTLLDFHAATYDARLYQPPHQHDDLHLSIVLRGRIAETVGGRTERAGTLSVVAKDPGVVHADAFGPEGATVARLSLAGGGVSCLVDDERRAFAWRWSHDLAVAVPFLRLVRRAAGPWARFAPDDADVVDVLAAITARRASTTRGDPPAWLARVVERIRDGWTPGLRVTDVAHDARVHPVYLARCVRRWYGTGVAELMRQQRLRVAAQRIGAATGTVSTIAHATGFADEAHLCREFKRTLGITPGRFRSVLPSGGALRRAV